MTTEPETIETIEATRDEGEFNCPSCNKDTTEAELDRHEGECCDECDADPELRAKCLDCDTRTWVDDLQAGRCETCYEAVRDGLIVVLDAAMDRLIEAKDGSLEDVAGMLARLKVAGIA